MFLSLLLYLFFSPTAYGVQCKQILEVRSEGAELSGLNLLEQLEEFVSTFSTEGLRDIKATKKEVMGFKKRGGSFEALKILNQGRMLTVRMAFWLTLESRLFEASSSSMENAETIRRAEAVYDSFSGNFLGAEISKVITVAKSNKTPYKARERLATELKRYSRFFSGLQGKEVDLLTERAVLELFGVKKRFELVGRREYLEVQNRELHARIHPFLENVNLRNGADVLEELSEYFLGIKRPKLSGEDSGFFKKGPSGAEVRTLVQALHLEPNIEKQHMDELDRVTNSFGGRSGWQRAEHLGYTLILFKAFEESFGERYRAVLHYRDYLRSQSFLSVKIKIQQAEYARLIVEAQIEGYINKSEELNARVERVIGSTHRRAERYSEHAEAYKRIREGAEALEVRDFDENLEKVEREISKLEIELDEVTEEVLRKIRNENIEDFEDLNHRWRRLLPNKAYSLEGADYSSVSFSAEVLSFFEKDQLTGSRYLTALSKSYVALKNASGLRSIPKIHQDFRDIKVLQKGKIRIIGRLVGKRIYFFRIYNQDRRYNHVDVRSWINAFSK